VANQTSWEHHQHDAIVHTHRHFHVTHNYREMTGGFEHLSSEHEHEHDHAEIAHAHYPHEDFESEHHGEAHDHDHDFPVKRAAKRAPAKKAAPTSEQ
jgi:hypothetical protein